MNETTTTGTGEERALPCFVHHPDAGGLCGREAVMKIYGLDFCEAHGEEVRIGAVFEQLREVETLFEGFRNPHVTESGSDIESTLRTTLDNLHRDAPTGDKYLRALLQAYPNPPEDVRERVRRWQLDEGPEGPAVFDILMDTLGTLRRLIRIAYEDGERWLVEVLEEHRESIAAQAAVALADLEERAGNPTR